MIIGKMADAVMLAEQITKHALLFLLQQYNFSDRTVIGKLLFNSFITGNFYEYHMGNRYLITEENDNRNIPLLGISKGWECRVLQGSGLGQVYNIITKTKTRM